MQESNKENQPRGQMRHKNMYRNLLVMAGLSFVAMYILMYAMVNRLDNVHNSFNQVYMAGLMAAPMVVIELLLMSAMYPDKRRNALIIAASVLIGLVFYVFIRQQTAITDRQFLRSMIPHYAGAILMCEQAKLRDPEIKDLCQSIIKGQQSEIDQMNAILDRLSTQSD